MVEVTVNAGACKFCSYIRVESEDLQNATIDFKTDCPNLKPLTEELKEVDGFKECFGKIGDSNVYKITGKYCKHVACPVPSAIIKGIEAACELALPKDVEVKIKKI